MQTESNVVENFLENYIVVSYNAQHNPNTKPRGWEYNAVVTKMKEGKYFTKYSKPSNTKIHEADIGLSVQPRPGSKLKSDVDRGAVYINTVPSIAYTEDYVEEAIFRLLWGFEDLQGNLVSPGLIPQIISSGNLANFGLDGIVTAEINPGNIEGSGLNYNNPNAYVRFMEYLSRQPENVRRSTVKRLATNAAELIISDLRNRDVVGYNAFIDSNVDVPVRVVGVYPYLGYNNIPFAFFNKSHRSENSYILSFLRGTGVGFAFAKRASLFYRKILAHSILLDFGIYASNYQAKLDDGSVAKATAEGEKAVKAVAARHKAKMSIDTYVQVSRALRSGVKVYVPATKTFIDSADMYDLVKPRPELVDLVVSKTNYINDNFKGYDVSTIPEFDAIDISELPSGNAKVKKYSTNTADYIKFGSFAIQVKNTQGVYESLVVPAGLIMVSPKRIAGQDFNYHVVGGESAIISALMALKGADSGYDLQSAKREADTMTGRQTTAKKRGATVTGLRY